MDQYSLAQEFVDLMAKALQILVQASERDLYALDAMKASTAIGNDVKQKIDAPTITNVQQLLERIHSILIIAQACTNTDRLLYAKALCQYLDQLISYSDDMCHSDCIWANNRIFLHCLVPVQSDRTPVTLKSLNSNYLETGVCISPKFPVSNAINTTSTPPTPRPLASRNALYGINGSLLNVSYRPYKTGSPEVQHIILSERACLKDELHLPQETRITFSPLTDRSDLLVTENCDLTIAGTQYSGFEITRLADPPYIEERFKNIWLESCKVSPDIFFAPEMLSTDNMIRIENGGSAFLKPLLVRAAIEGWNAPRLTIMPTHWKNRANQLLVFDETGRHLGTQFKCTPYVDKNENRIEALSQTNGSDVLMIHMKNQQRIAIAICAEFIANPERITHFLCEQLCATLLLVPSYSNGERDFIDSLSTLKPYGTSVIWGNCCGAVHDDKPHAHMQRTVGGCSYAGIDCPNRFGTMAKCNFHCGTSSVCFFVVNIPTAVSQGKISPGSIPKIEHINN